MIEWRVPEALFFHYLSYLGLTMVYLAFVNRRDAMIKGTVTGVGILILLGFQLNHEQFIPGILIWLVFGVVAWAGLYLNRKVLEGEREIALEQAALKGRHETLLEDVEQQKEAEKEMFMKVTQLQNLYLFSQTIAQILDFDDFLREIEDGLAGIFEYEAAQLVVYPESGLLELLQLSREQLTEADMEETPLTPSAITEPLSIDIRTRELLTKEEDTLPKMIIQRLGRQEQVIWNVDQQPDLRAPRISGMDHYAMIPIEFEDRTVSVILLANPRLKPSFTHQPDEILATLQHQLSMGFGKALLFMRLRTLSRIDSLTGALKRWYFQQRLDTEIKRAGENQQSISLIMLDIDYFKNYNDSYGHLVGDRVLQEVSSFLVSSLRMVDLCCRYGGEEFLLALPATDKEAALQVAERIRIGLAQKAFPVTDKTTHITLSSGISTFPEDGDMEEVIQLADKSLYRAKAAGRNCIRVHGSPS